MCKVVLRPMYCLNDHLISAKYDGIGEESSKHTDHTGESPLLQRSHPITVWCIIDHSIVDVDEEQEHSDQESGPGRVRC